MTQEELKASTKEEVMNFIRETLALPHVSNIRDFKRQRYLKEHYRFNMSGYEDEMGECTLLNTSIVNKFANLGIYNYTNYLFLDFYKGVGTIYFKYFYIVTNGFACTKRDDDPHEIDVDGLTTTEIIYKIFELTILSDRKERRRD